MTPDHHLPRESWWLDCDRATFAAKAKAEQERMALSPFGKLVSLTHAESEPVRPAPKVAEEDFAPAPRVRA